MTKKGTIHKILLDLRNDAVAETKPGKAKRRTSVKSWGFTAATVDSTRRALSKAGKGLNDHDTQSGSLAYFETSRKMCMEDIQNRQKEHQATRQRLQELRATYLFGLNQISTLEDLRDAPDAIMPGNFP